MLRRRPNSDPGNDSGSVIRPLGGNINLHAMHRIAPERYPFLLQSTASDSTLGRFDILFACPGEALVLNDVGHVVGQAGHTNFLSALDEQWRAEYADFGPADLPFTGGWFLYLGYELAGEIEPALRVGNDPHLPIAFAVRCKAALVSDNDTGECSLVHENDAALDMDALEADIVACRGLQAQESGQIPELAGTTEDPPGNFVDAVLSAKAYIGAGDIYQANLSRGWSATLDENSDADHIYASLSRSNPAPFAGLVRWNDTTIISSSPERLLRIDDGVISTRPIAGTRPRSDDKDIDDSLSAELFSHPKEIAEHVMLIDLERNDLGRVCEPGTVEIDEMMVLESYAHVHHIVSNVRGKLLGDVTPGDAIRAVFPGGTITGCPKVRCMEIIQELEQCPRGAYTGSFGYLNRNGSMDLNILIRTIVIRGNSISFRCGSGIVADSEADAELAETRAKAKGMLRALSA